MNSRTSRKEGVFIIIRLQVFFLIFFAALALPCFAGVELPESGPLSLEEATRDLFLQHPGKSGAFVLEKGEDALLTRAWLTERAARSIDVQYFIWSTDNIGILAAENLLRAAERGTRVRVIVDDFLVDAPDETMVALAAHPNIEIRIYNPRNSVGISTPERVLGLISNFRSFNQRMHDKTFIVDGLVAITGGRNMADEYFDYDHQYNFRDRDILLLGPVVADMEKSFETFWQSDLAVSVESLLAREKKRLRKERVAEIYQELYIYALDPENYEPAVRQALADLSGRMAQYAEQLVWDDIVFVCDLPGKNLSSGFSGSGRSTEMLVDAVSKAEKSITIQSPYLVIPSGGIEFFAKLVKKGVDVRINTNSLASTDNLQAFSGYSKQRRKIIRAGIKVYEFRPEPAIQKDLINRYERLKQHVPTFAIHAKTMVIDSELVFIGTFNLDPRSANLNTEIGVLIRNRELARKVEEYIERDMLPENSWDAAADTPDSRAPLWKRVQVSLLKTLPIQSLL
ncbi:MAG: phospholipase D family protein [Desulfobulbaceae bacterium]|nr:phospholipase D family protein [Desulfobulbaceae bacterium]